MPKKNVDILVIALSSPILVGIYEDGLLVDEVISEKKSSDVLPMIFKDLFQKYNIKNLYYTNGPGSFMAIKVAYIFLKSITVLKDIPFFATDAFKFNKNSPIKAIGKLCFVKIDSEIKTQKMDSYEVVEFKLPNMLKKEEFSTDTAPLYKIDAVGK